MTVELLSAFPVQCDKKYIKDVAVTQRKKLLSRVCVCVCVCVCVSDVSMEIFKEKE